MRSRLLFAAAISSLLTLSGCTTPTTTTDISLPFMGFGNEPGWSITFNEAQPAEIQLDYGQRKLTLELPAPQTTYAGRHYRTTYQNQPLTVDIIYKSCNDTMSDNHFDYEVLFSIEGQHYKGCGRPLPPAN